MQNIDFYDGNGNRNLPPQFERPDTEYFSRISGTNFKDDERQRKKASRIISLIAALCILSFTTGLVIGIKFSTGSNKDIVDPKTYKAVTNIKQQVSSLIETNEKDTINSFSINDFPYVIKVGSFKNKTNSQNLANLLSHKGHRVIISRKNNLYKLYTGPYKSIKEAKESLQDLKSYDTINNIKIYKRK